MAVSLPDGATIAIATTYGSVKTVTAITNANPGVITSAAHGLLNGAFYELKSGWQKISDRVFKAANVATNALDVNRAVQSATAAALRAIQVVNKVAKAEA